MNARHNLEAKSITG